MRQILVIRNPVSGPAFLRPSRETLIAAFEKRGVQATLIETRPTVEGDLRQAVQGDFERIIVVGGDGTVREVAELLIAGRIATPLAIIAQGTGNILAGSLGIPLFPLNRAIDFALNNTSDAIDVFRINGRRICLVGAGQGYDAQFIRGATRDLKRRIGPLAYAWSFFRSFFFYRAERYTVIVDGVRHQVTAKLVLALNVFGVVGIPIEREVSPRDGLIDVFVFNPRTIWETLWTALAIVVRLPRRHIPRLEAFQGTRVSIRQRKGRHIQIDGDIEADKHLDIEILPRALHIVHGTL